MSVIERFLHYVSFPTASDEEAACTPSTARQLALGGALEQELRSLGLETAFCRDTGCVYGLLPANADTEENLGFIAHIDTSPAAPGEHISPRIVEYHGGDVELGNGVVTGEATFPVLKQYVGKHLIVTDGSTLLGADDKAGVAEIVSMLAYFVAHPEVPHKRIAVAFTPDEEVGRGTENFDLARFHADTAYTVDGGGLGEIEYECFNAASVKVRVHGVNIHPGSAKDKMKNAALMAADYISRMPAAETPAHTEKYEGFYHLCEMRGDESEALLKYIVRDHDKDRFASRKDFMLCLGDYLNTVYGEGTFTVEVKDSYYNMRALIEDGHMDLIENAVAAMQRVGVTPKIVPIRGGTDGAMLTYRGLPCPNLSVGGENFHGVHEFACVEDMHKMVEVLTELAKL